MDRHGVKTRLPKANTVAPVRAVLFWVWSFLVGISALHASRPATAASPEERSGLRSSSGVLNMGGEHGGPLLVDYYRTFLADRDIEAYRGRVNARYSEATLDRILSDSPDPLARRGAVLALGLGGQFKTSNKALGHALRDLDSGVRSMAEDALWSLWFRADTPENNATLEAVRDLVGLGRFDQAISLANQLIAAAPDFAEAYNQRALAYYLQGRMAESARDCRETLKRNPVHFGAISGLAKCQLGLNRPREALESLRQALKITPYSDPLREAVKALEAEIGPEGAR